MVVRRKVRLGIMPNYRPSSESLAFLVPILFIYLIVCLFRKEGPGDIEVFWEENKQKQIK